MAAVQPQQAHGHPCITLPGRMAVQIEDLLGVVEQANLPDTVDEHPNWRRRIALPVERWADDPRLRSAAAAIGAGRNARR